MLIDEITSPKPIRRVMNRERWRNSIGRIRSSISRRSGTPCPMTEKRLTNPLSNVMIADNRISSTIGLRAECVPVTEFAMISISQRRNHDVQPFKQLYYF
jgi:hypothetical protein